MKVILKEDVKALGKKGDVVEVSDGYARNFILKTGKGVEANGKNLNDLKLKKANDDKVAQEHYEAAVELGKKIEAGKIQVSIKTGEGGKVFGSVSSKEIAAEVKSQLGLEVDKKKVQHKLIRRVSMDQFYWILTGDKNAFYKVCMKLPEVINSVINEESGVTVPNDTVIEELRRLSLLYEEQPEDLAMAMAVYMLGFSTYMGFANRIEQKLDCGDEKKIKRIYEYAKKIK